MNSAQKSNNAPLVRQALMLLSNCFDPDPRVHNEARSLVEHGYGVEIVAWDRERLRPANEAIDGIEVRRVFVASSHGRGWTQMFVMPLVFLRMIRKALSVNFDIVHCHDFDTLPAGLLLGWIRRKPVVYDSHEDYAGMLHGSIPGRLERLIRWMETRLARRADLLVTVGETLRREFEKRGCKNTRVVGNWKAITDFRLGEDVAAQVRKDLGVPAGKLMAAYISNLGRERHVEELLQAVAQRPEVYLVVGGTGSSATAVAEYARKYSNILYLGFVQQSEVPRYTAACDLVYYGYDVNSPNAQYSAPNKLFEALAAGRPLLTANFGEIGAIVSGHNCGIILRDYSVQEILRGLDACGDAQRLTELKAAAARAGAGEYNWQAAERVLLGAYNELVPGRQARHSDRTSEAVAQ